MANPPLPAYLQDRPFEDPTEQLLDSLGTGAPPVLSLLDDRFTLVDAAGDGQPIETFDKGVPYIDCVLIDSNPRQSKIFYDHAYNSNEAGPPTCFSDNGVAPSRNAGNPQSPTCASCKWFPWGSATSAMTGKGVKACKDYQKVAIMVPGFDGIYLLRVPPNSLKSLREYSLRFKGSGTSISDVVTRIRLEQKTLQFAGVSYIDQPMAQKRNEARARNLTADLVGKTDVPIAGAFPTQEQHFVDPSPPAVVNVERTAIGGAVPPPNFQPAPLAAPPGAAPSSAPVSPPAGRGRGRGRPRSSNGPGQQAPQPSAQPESAPFPVQGAPAFGISTGAAPGGALNAALDSFFGPAPQK